MWKFVFHIYYALLIFHNSFTVERANCHLSLLLLKIIEQKELEFNKYYVTMKDIFSPNIYNIKI